ncbi:hypothetical protein M8818_005841 [Zalaria obscura]|uniref:Uncharacterized protein n=1 Tax=Zalaria obscura TaxID=2024903 RepID=A0ACC3S9I3_9PEZI
MAPSADIAASTHASGDPDLAFVHDETTAPPSFRDKYAERAYLKHRLAIAFRIFAQFGFAEGVAGHITLRDPVDPTSFWVNPFGMHFSLIKDEDLIRVDHAGNVVDGGKNRRLNYGWLTLPSGVCYPFGDPSSSCRRALRRTLSQSLWSRLLCNRPNTGYAHTRRMCLLQRPRAVPVSESIGVLRCALSDHRTGISQA